jgi:hypothetical protein
MMPAMWIQLLMICQKRAIHSLPGIFPERDRKNVLTVLFAGCHGVLSLYLWR